MGGVRAAASGLLLRFVMSRNLHLTRQRLRRSRGLLPIAGGGRGPQLGFIIPLTTETQGYLNLKSYWEFANQNRPAGWNGWVTFVISPAEQTPSTAPRRMITK